MRWAAAVNWQIRREHRERTEARVAYYSALVAKYRRAAAMPWLGVAPDPPLPAAGRWETAEDY